MPERERGKESWETAELSLGASALIDQVLESAGGKSAGLNLWLKTALRRFPAMAESLDPSLNVQQEVDRASSALASGDEGKRLSEGKVRESAASFAQSRGVAKIGERDVLAAILKASGRTPVFQPELVVSAASATTSSTESAQSGSRRKTPNLDKLGRDLTSAARSGRLPRVLGRDEEVATAVEVLCKVTKRNPVLLGPAGVGKTAIAEALAVRIVAGDVPDMLKNVRLIELQPSVVTAGMSMVGQIEARMQALVEEASAPDIILFIDEVHSMIGSGGHSGTGDMASLLKPALARGEIACIAATTDDEYRRYIETDSALERRFQPINVLEMSCESALEIARARAEDSGARRGVGFAPEAVEWLVDFADKFMRNRRFPDKAIDLVEQCIGHAVSKGQTQVTVDEAKAVARRLIGMPTSPEDRIKELARALGSSLPPADVAALRDRLNVTIRSLDINPSRPNAVVLLIGEAADNALQISQAIARSVFGSGDRVVRIDFGRFTDPNHITMLLGAPPSYVGYDQALEIHQLTRTPWAVVLCENVDVAHPSVLRVLTEALDTGFITDAQSRRVYFSDAVVVASAESAATKRTHVGFGFAAVGAPKGGTECEGDLREAAAALLGQDFVEQCDVISEGCAAGHLLAGWLEQALLPAVAERYLQNNIQLEWDESFVGWLRGQGSASDSAHEWERRADALVGPQIVAALDAKEAGAAAHVKLSALGGGMKVDVD